ncbi:hypothetical protein O988_04208 [Pseudogymnoascus sp. VKM F-3808]|nr:hypothetical protein O988_04208 [Pseudogymnoascus sp. VKM F-3808]
MGDHILMLPDGPRVVLEAEHMRGNAEIVHVRLSDYFNKAIVLPVFWYVKAFWIGAAGGEALSNRGGLVDNPRGGVEAPINP